MACLLCRVPSNLLERPYDLLVVARGMRNQAEHFIMSQQGVTCIRNGVISEYTPLQEWDHHRRQAQLLALQSMLPQSSMNKYNRTCLHPVTQAAAQAAHPADAIAQRCRCEWPQSHSMLKVGM